MIKKETQHQKRIRKIHFIYKYELLDKPLDLTDAFENYNYTSDELDELDEFNKEYEDLRGIISHYIKSTWTWDRLPILERAVLLEGAFELRKMDSGIVINEMIIYSKEYLLDNKYKFINAILQKISSEYAKQKI